MKTYPSLALFLLAALVAQAPAARAGIVLNFSGGTVTAGGQITIDVTASGTSPLSDFSLGFQLTGGTLTTPTFVNPSSASTDPTLTAPSYVFAVGSDDKANNTTFGNATPNFAGGPAVNFQGGDLEDGADAPLSAGHNLLAALVIQAPSFVVSPSGSDFYTLKLVTNQTSFDTSGGITPVALDPSSVEQVTIQVVRASATTPEPASFVSIAIGLSVAWLARRRTRG